MDNLNSGLEAMSRNIRYGYTYHCGSGAIDVAQDCASGGTILAFEQGRTGDPNNPDDQIVYDYVGETIEKCIGRNSSTCIPIIAQEAKITSLTFYVTGSYDNDGKQPMVMMVVKGYAGNSLTDPHKAEFKIETLVSQRKLDS